MKNVNSLDIAGYLKIEIEDILKHLHYYKLKNILQNIEALKEYLLVLDRQNTAQIHELDFGRDPEREKKNHDLHYFVSKWGLTHIGEIKMHQKIWENEFNLQHIMQWVRGFLLLTIDEFCNASPTRMSINRMFWQKELQNTKKPSCELVK